MTHDDVVDTYNARTAGYIASIGQVDKWLAADRELLTAWARRVEGLLLDVGCGPGHWPDLLRSEEADIVGIDPGSEFIENARKQFPFTKFRIGRAQSHCTRSPASVLRSRMPERREQKLSGHRRRSSR